MSKEDEKTDEPLNTAKGISTGFYIRIENIKILEEEELKQDRSLSWLVNNAIEQTYGSEE